MPFTETEKAKKRLVQANSYKTNGVGGNNSALLVGGGGMAEDQEPVEFVHLKTWGRNYALLQVKFGWRFYLFYFTMAAVSRPTRQTIM